MKSNYYLFVIFNNEKNLPITKNNVLVKYNRMKKQKRMILCLKEEEKCEREAIEKQKGE